MSGLLCLVKYSSVPTPLLYVSCSSGLPLSSGFSNLLAVNLGVPDVMDSLSFMALLPKFYSTLLIMDGCPKHPLVSSLDLIFFPSCMATTTISPNDLKCLMYFASLLKNNVYGGFVLSVLTIMSSNFVAVEITSHHNFHLSC